MSKNTLLLSVKTFKERSVAHKNLDDKLIEPEIKAAQDMEIEPALGSKLYKRLQDGITAANLTTNERLLLDNYVADALINFTLAALPLATGFQFFTNGVSRRTSENSEQPTTQDLRAISNHYSKRGEYYRERLIRYIGLNKADYPDYGCSDDQDISPSNSGYTLPCWLPD